MNPVTYPLDLHWAGTSDPLMSILSNYAENTQKFTFLQCLFLAVSEDALICECHENLSLFAVKERVCGADSLWSTPLFGALCCGCHCPGSEIPGSLVHCQQQPTDIAHKHAVSGYLLVSFVYAVTVYYVCARVCVSCLLVCTFVCT